SVTTSDDEAQEVKESARSCSNLRCATVMAPARIAAAELYFTAKTQRGTMPVRTTRKTTRAIHVSSRVKPPFACCFVCILMQPAFVLTQLVTFTLTVIDEPHCEVKVTLKGPRNVFFDLIEKLEPELETLWEPGETVRLEGKVATTRLGLLMLTRTLPVVPPFFLMDILDELT